MGGWEGGCKAPWIVSIVVSCSTMNYVNRWTGDINYPPRQIFRVLVMGWINVLEINLLGELLSRINNWISRIFRAQNPSGDIILQGRKGTNESFGKCLFKGYLHILFECLVMRNKIRIFRNLKMERKISNILIEIWEKVELSTCCKNVIKIKLIQRKFSA